MKSFIALDELDCNFQLLLSSKLGYTTCIQVLVIMSGKLDTLPVFKF